jgi:hypothetical protein
MGAAETPVRTPPKPNEPKKSMRERVDPKIKSLDGVDNAVRVSGKNPDRWYVWANERPVASNTGGDVAYYLNLAPAMGLEEADGYVVERVERGGVRAPGALSQVEGEPIANVYGNVLVSCPLEFKRLVDSIGHNGQGGQEEADRVEKLMITRRGLQDHMRGVGSPGMFRVTADEEHGATEIIERRQRG